MRIENKRKNIEKIIKLIPSQIPNSIFGQIKSEDKLTQKNIPVANNKIAESNDFIFIDINRLLKAQSYLLCYFLKKSQVGIGKLVN